MVVKINPALLRKKTANIRKDEAKKAIVLLSGGIDSTTALFWAKQKGYNCFCLIFDYGQRHKKEIRKAELIAKKAGSEYQVLRICLSGCKSSLVDKNIPLAKGKISKSIPSTYVPARNIIFLSFAVSFAESKNINAIIIGTNQIDYSNYPDCRGEFLRAFQAAINKGTKSGVTGNLFKIIAPLENKTKAHIIKTANKLNVPLEMTWSCYSGGRKPCGRCPSCIIRARGFRQAGLEDPLLGR